MATVEERVKHLNEKRLRAFEAGKAILDRAMAEGRGTLTMAEQAGYDRADAEITKYDRQRGELLSSDAAQRERGDINEEYRRVAGPAVYDEARGHEKQVMADFLSGRTKSLTVDLRRASYAAQAYRDGVRGDELRGIFGDAGGGSLTLPTLVSQTIFEVMQSANVMRQTRMSILTTNDGAPLAIPVGSQGIATQIASQNTAFSGTDPTMAAKFLHAYPAGQLVAIANDLVTDSGVDILQWVSQTIAVAVAKQEETWWVAGTGSGQPQGIMTAGATGAAGTIATGGSLILGPAGAVVEKLIDVQYGVNSRYRSRGEWLTNDSTAATMRKLRADGGGTVGPFLWSPSPTVGLAYGQPDTFMGDPIHVSTNVSAMGSSNTVLAFGDFSYFVAREVGGLQLEQSQDLYFNLNQVAARGYTRTDSALTDTTAVVTLHQAVS